MIQTKDETIVRGGYTFVRQFDVMAFLLRYVCATCWGRLNFINDQVICDRSIRGECTGRGYVTAKYAERRRQESAGELAEVKWNYPDLFESHRKPRTIAEMYGK